LLKDFQCKGNPTARGSIETNNIVTTFNVGGFGNGVTTVYDESRNIPVTAGQFTDAFEPNAVHIYKIPIGGGTTVIYGDVSGDGEVTAYDAALAAQASVGIITLTPEQTVKADVSGDGEVSAYDAALIAQYSVGIINKFPVEG